MAKQTINVGTAPNDGTGDTLKASFTKCNANFTELYAGAGVPASQFVGFRAFKTANQVTGTTYTKLTFPTEDYDYGGYYDTTASRWTPPAGLVHISASYITTSGGTVSQSFGSIAVFKNGAAFKQSYNLTAGTYDGVAIGVDDYANGTDYYEVYSYTTNANTIAGDANGNGTWFCGHVTGGPKGDVGPTGASGAALAAPSAPQGRLTLVASTPVMTATQAAATTLRYTPYVGDRIPIYDGTNMTMTGFSELTNITTDSATGKAGPAAVAASSVYDLFVWSDAGTLRLTRGPAWTNDTTRSVGTALVRIGGFLFNNAAITNGPAASRGTYVGTVRSNASSTLDWIFGTGAAVAGWFGVWNMYNRVDVATMVSEAAISWVCGTNASAARAVNANNANRVSFVMGLAEDGVSATYTATFTGTSADAYVGIGLNSTTGFSGHTSYLYLATSGTTLVVIGGYDGMLLGFNFLQACEQCPSNGGTFYGFIGTSPNTPRQGFRVRLKM